jgi:cohesin loading factor subunit SCC2
VDRSFEVHKNESWNDSNIFILLPKCVEGDQNLMLIPIIKKAVSKRLSDESISVREAAVALVGNYIARSPIAIGGYHSVLMPCLTDPGVSVRKRAVKIFQSILIRNPHYQRRVEVFNVLLRRSIDPKEEDSVRDLVDEVLYILWFRSGTVPIAHQQMLSDPGSSVQSISVPGVVTPNTPVTPGRRKSVQSRSDVTAEQMMEVMQSADAGSSLEAVLTKLLKGDCNLGLSGQKRPDSMERFELNGNECTEIVDSLCELLVIIDEQRDIRPNVGRDISSTLKTLAIFGTVSPGSLLKHLDTFLPYLKADNGVSMDDESGIICSTCDILYRLAPVLDQQTINRQTSLSISKDITKLAYKFGPAVLISTMRAFSALANQSSIMGQSTFADKLLALAKTFYGYAMKRNDIDDFSSLSVSSTSCSVSLCLRILSQTYYWTGPT